MQKDSKLFEDMAKMATGAAGTMMDMKQEMESGFRAKVEECLRNMNFVTRDEFDAVKAMAEKARDENDALRAEIEALKK